MGWISPPRQIVKQAVPRALGTIVAVVLAFSLVLAQPSSSRMQAGSSQSDAASQTQSPFGEAEQLLSQGAVEQAKEKIRQQLALHPKSVEGYNLLGIAFSAEKDYSNALESFQQALKIDPNSTKTHNNLGNLYIAEGKPDRVLSDPGVIAAFLGDVAETA